MVFGSIIFLMYSLNTHRILCSTLQVLLLVFALFSASMLLAGNQTVSSKWATMDAEQQSSDQLDWQSGKFANLGFSDKTLLFQLHYGQLAKQQYLTVTPSYLDRVKVSFYDQFGELISTELKGDHVLDSALDYSLDLDQLVFIVPLHSHSAKLVATSTSNLRVSIDLKDLSSVLSKVSSGLVVKVGVLAFLLMAGGIALVVGLTNREGIYLFFAAYLGAWAVLIIGISNFLVTLDPNLILLNDRLVSFGAIGATIAGVMFYAKLLFTLVRRSWYHWAILLVSMMSFISLALYLFVDQRLGLQLNIILVLIGALIVLIGLPFWRPKNHISRLLVKKTRWPLAILLLFVLFSSVSGLGEGESFSITYLQALLTSMLFGYLLLLWFVIGRRRNVSAAVKAKLLTVTNQRLNHQIFEQRTLLAMLAHEVKTPLTTLKFLNFDSPKREETEVQLNHIGHVIDQTDAMNSLDKGLHARESINLQQMLSQQISTIRTAAHADAKVEIRVRGSVSVFANEFAIKTLLHNLLDNAIKYGDEGGVKVLLVGHAGGATILVKNNTRNINAVNLPYVTEKYWRASADKGTRGTGLGLWIVTRLCQQQHYDLRLSVRRNQFLVSVNIPS